MTLRRALFVFALGWLMPSFIALSAAGFFLILGSIADNQAEPCKAPLSAETKP